MVVLSVKALKPCDANVDSGCSQLMTPHADQLTSPQPDKRLVWLADDSVIRATHCGITHPVRSTIQHSTLLVPSLHEPLLSVAGLADDGFITVFDKKQVLIHNKNSLCVTQTPIAVGKRRGNLYYLPECVSGTHVSSAKTYADHSLLD